MKVLLFSQDQRLEECSRHQPHSCRNFIRRVDDKETPHGSLCFNLICSVQKPKNFPSSRDAPNPPVWKLSAWLDVCLLHPTTPHCTLYYPVTPAPTTLSAKLGTTGPHRLWDNAKGLLLPLTTYSSMNWRRSLKPCFSAMVFG